MSMVSTEKIICPVCKKESDFTVWQSLNAKLDPEAVPRLLDGSLFRFTCPHCNHQASVEYDLLYHDMDNRAMVYYTQPMSRSSVKEQVLQAETVVGSTLNAHRKRIVTSREALAEKIMIFRLGLDDRAVELMKLTTLARLMEACPQAEIKDVRFRADGEKCYLDFLGGKAVSVEVARASVEMICRQFPELWEAGAVADNLFIDDRWAYEFLEKKTDL